jgi:Kef-type K+ transport system membrane component KefB
MIVGESILFIFVGWAVRLIVTYFVSYSKEYTWKDRLFIVATWSPKATVQAALASVFLNEAKLYNLGPEYITYGIMIQTTAILSICITAPIGAVLMQTLGPRLLPVETELPVETGATEENLKDTPKDKITP